MLVTGEADRGTFGVDEALIARAEQLAIERDARARDVLVALATTNGAISADASRRCFAAASGMGFGDLELHFALRAWWKSKGSPAGQKLLLRALSHRPELATAAFRLAGARMRVEDWSDVASADPFARWPAIAALTRDGRWHAQSLDELLAVDRLSTIVAEGETVGWVMRDMRVTRQGRSVAIGARCPDGGWSYVPSVSAVDPTATKCWRDEPQRVDGRVGLLSTRFSFHGYWHWMIEGLQPLLSLATPDLAEHLDQVLCFVNRSGPPSFIAQSMREVGVDGPNLWTCASSIDIAVDELVVPAGHPGAGGIVDDSTIMPDPLAGRPGTRLEAFVAAIRAGMDSSHRRTAMRRRLLVSRRDARERRIANEDELERALRSQDFEIIVPGALTVHDQAEAFGSAEIIVGPHGAGLTNLLFARPGARVVEIQPAGLDRPYFRWIAEAAQLEYDVLDAQSVPGPTNDMVVDVEAVTALIDRVGR